MKCILFVDDDMALLNSFPDAFDKQAFKVMTASSGEKALELMEKEAVDLVISDLLMPDMDGVTFLGHVKTDHPAVLRMLMSGYSEEHLVFKALHKNIVKHYLFKPWNNGQLVSAIEHVLNTQALLEACNLFLPIQHTGHLPTIPDKYNAIIGLIENDASAMTIAKAIESDQAIASQILHVANSAYYGGKTGNISQAVTQIGLRSTRELVLSTSVIHAFETHIKEKKRLSQIWQHAFLTNQLVDFLYGRLLHKKLPTHYQSAGLLHNIGIVFLLSYSEKTYLNIWLRANHENEALSKVEKDTFGVQHEQAGGYLMDWWGFPFPIVEACLYHHQPFNAHIIHQDLIWILHLAQQTAARLIQVEFNEVFEVNVFEALGITQEHYQRILEHFNYERSM